MSRPPHTQPMVRARVSFPRPLLTDIEGRVGAELQASRTLFPASGRIAIAVGSRGVANIARIVRATVNTIAGWGLEPFIVPAMGSHGGATAEGQQQLLADYGVTEEGVGCPVRSSMDVVELDRGDLPHGLYMDRYAYEAAGVVLINRVKPHTDFHGRYESGLAKMAVIGLGKESQAVAIHRFGVPGLRDLMPRAARRVLETGRVVAGLATVENAYDETMAIEVIPARAMLDREPVLLDLARANMPSLPVEALDVLVVDQLGKDISGTGLDTNVIGRMRIAGEAEPTSPRIGSIMVSDLTLASHGNAAGCGLADVITRRLFEKIDIGVTYTNIFTSGFPERGKIPIVAPTDRDAFICAWRACGPIPAEALRVIRIQDTLHLGEIRVSPAVAEEVRARGLSNVTCENAEEDLFDAEGSLRAP